MAARGCDWPVPSYKESTGSTNADAALLVASGAVDGTCLVAGQQTAGRGRHGRSWVSAPGAGLWSSTIIRGRERPGRLPLIAALAVVDLAHDLAGASWGIKWPNDVLGSDGRKVAGILVQAMTDAAVVGIGINVEHPPQEYPQAGSWVDECSVSPDRSELLAGLLIALHARVHQPWTDALADYRGLCRTLGQQVRVSLPGGEVFEGVGHDIDAEGHLLVQAGQTMRTVVAGDVLHATIAP